MTVKAIMMKNRLQIMCRGHRGDAGMRVLLAFWGDDQGGVAEVARDPDLAEVARDPDLSFNGGNSMMIFSQLCLIYLCLLA